MAQKALPAVAGVQVNAIPFISPLINTDFPWCSMALRSRLSVPMHQLSAPHIEQVSVPEIVGGEVGGGSQTTLQEKQHPLQGRPSWSTPPSEQDIFLSQQEEYPLQGLL